MSASALKNNPRLLIVDDREDDVFLLTHALKKGGVTIPIETFENGLLAVDTLPPELEDLSALAHEPGDERTLS